MITNKKKKWGMFVLGLLVALSVHAATPVSKQYVDALIAVLEYELSQKII